MSIPVKNLLSHQYIKLFSNPVSGLVCTLGECEWKVSPGLQSIRYSKSMVLKALEFWHEKLHQYYTRLKRIHNPLNPRSSESIIISQQSLIDIINLKKTVADCPNTFLFSHRYINRFSSLSFTDAMRRQRKLISRKLSDVDIMYQTVSLDPYYWIGYYDSNEIVISVFPNMHPYIPKQKITRVGKTNKGNVFVIHEKK